ncbi:hypothetical protein SSX86_031489 [Deinandra increscens subsp. villosa]|uniref:TIR domain-containing protein n=1 Tax=Deinandra increscens subsp. villosa TaxID=3103831 RepID=A0AAP0GI62_9ASTR
MAVLTEIPEASSPSSSLSTYDYDVFLSFRGTDTRYNFTDHLLKALREATIDTFFDDSEIQIGDFLKPELENAIKSSRASIIVLSKDYASSTWCLDELALIMERRRTSKHIVFPIFYYVKPSDVRKQQNSFGDAMVKHLQRMEAESDAEIRSQLARKVEKWKKALTEVADMKGEEADGRRRETILIEQVVKDISSRLHLHTRSKLSHIIGRESSIRMITSFLKDGSRQSTEILTIWGMAGIGKTYLANYVFQLHYLDFERSCFLGDIERKCTSPYGMLDLQKQLLKDIRVGSWMDINNVNVGTFKIEKSLFRNRTLLVLDGINMYEQLDVLIGTKGLHPGTKIIITSVDGSLTEKCRLFETRVPPKHTKHLLHGLHNKESLQLLSWHAFGCNEPNESDKKESMKVIQYCKGHPLALEVLGSSLRSEHVTLEDILESLGKDINPKISEVLKISFDTLPSEKDKELFKHIACLFVGEDRKFTEDILRACGICKSSGIKILINRCLLTDKFKLQVLAEIDEEVLRSLGWINVKYLKHYKVSMADSDGCYHCTGKVLPTQMLYEHGIFSTYLEGQEVPKWITHRSNGSSVTLKSSLKNEANEEVIVWLSHWIFGNSEFEDGDEVCVDVSVQFSYGYDGFDLSYGGEGPDYANVREYGISLVYDDNVNQEEDPLGYYKSWNHIIGGDLSAAQSSSSHYLLKQRGI